MHLTLLRWLRGVRLTVLAFLCLLAAPLLMAETFTFTAIPDQDESRLNQRFGKVAHYLSRELGVEVKYIPVKNYAAAVTAFRNNQVQLAWFGGLSGVQARRLVPGSQAIAQGAEDVRFKSYLIAHHSTGLERSERLSDNLHGRSLAFGSKGSTSGRLMPEYFLRMRYGKAPEEIFSRVGFSGDHSRTLALVQSGAYELGVLNYQVWESALKEGLVDTGSVDVIWESPNYPDYQWTIRGDVDQVFGRDFAQRVKDALLAMNEPELLQAFPRSSFIEASNDDYRSIELTAIAIGLMEPR